MPRIVLPKFVGLNASQATLQLPKGEFTGLQNIRQRPFDNWVKRQGIEFSTAQTSPIMGIFEVELDNITIPIFQSGTALTFFPDLSTLNGSFTQPDPYPPTTPAISASRVVLFNVEQTMRAINNRRIVGESTGWAWPNLIFRSDGSRLNGNTGIAVADYPATNLYSPDLTFFDAFYGLPAGTRAAQLVNAVIDACIDTVNNMPWIKTIDGLAAVIYYDSTIFPAASSANKNNYRSSLTGCKTGIHKLDTIERGATQTSVETKTGTASDASTCSPPVSTVTVSGWSSSFFDAYAGSCDYTPDCQPCVNDGNPCYHVDNVCTPWDGSIIKNTADPCTFEAPNPNDLTPCLVPTVNNYPIRAIVYTVTGTDWTLQISNDNAVGCFDSLGDCYWVSSLKSGSSDPRGVYTFDGSSTFTGPPTITLV